MVVAPLCFGVPQGETAAGSAANKTFCFLCQLHVNKGSRHCRYCDKCVDKFDHHCKWWVGWSVQEILPFWRSRWSKVSSNKTIQHRVTDIVGLLAVALWYSIVDTGCSRDGQDRYHSISNRYGTWTELESPFKRYFDRTPSVCMHSTISSIILGLY